jgi:DNA-directed RNA polymerase specialized sigma24 family protein
MKMTKERLKQYRLLVLEAAQLEQELLEHLNSSYISGAVLDGVPRGNKVSDTVPKTAIESIELYAMLTAKKNDAARLRREIEECIAGLEPRGRTLMRERYIFGKTWEEVCVEINETQRTTHRLHSSILKVLSTENPAS